MKMKLGLTTISGKALPSAFAALRDRLATVSERSFEGGTR